MTEALQPAEGDFEIEETEEDEPLQIDEERRRVKTDKLDLPVETLNSWITRGKLDLQPEFQRFFVWDRAKSSRLIESLLLEIPIPVIYVSEENGKQYSVVDGQQRLTSVHSFVKGTYPDGAECKLSGLKVLTELNGQRFSHLEGHIQESILGAILRLIVIKRDSDPEVKFEVFERLNLGAQRLNDQEVRNCIYRGSYNRLLHDLAPNPKLRKILRLEGPDKRMRDCQLVLRFLALHRSTHLKYRGSMKSFLNREMEQHRNPDDRELAEMKKIFEKSIDMAYTVFGQQAFRRFVPGDEKDPNGRWEHRKINVALWDTVLYCFSFFEKSQIVPIADQVREEILDLITNDEKFVNYTTRTTDKAERIQYRGETCLQRLRALVADRQPRNFSLQLKTQLHEADPSCGLCGQRIHELDDGEVDHIEHYWRGGKTIPENARLAHRFCNRQRGGQH